jgi:hypothetical protein
MKSTKFYASVSILFCLLSNISFGQAYDSLFFNNGDQVYIQGGALLHIQGGLTNKNVGSTKTITNNGVIQVEGNIVNESGASFTEDGSKIEATVRLIGGSAVPRGTNNDQTISGNFSDTVSAHFYNLVIDKEAGSNTVTLKTDVAVKGSLVWNGSTNDASTYNHSTVNTTVGGTAAAPTRTNPTRSGKGLVLLYDPSSADHELYITNSDPTSIVGYQTLSTFNFSSNPSALSGSSNDGYIQARGVAAVAKGLSLQVDRAGTYVFPVGSPTSTYNPIEVHFNGTPGSPMKLTSKFSETNYASSSFSNTFDQTNSLSPAGTGSAYFTTHPIDYADNPGFNIYQQGCGGSPKLFIMDKILKNHGYWSFNASPALSGTTYVVQAYPHGYSEYVTNGSNPNKRILRTSAGGFTSAPAVSDFQSELETSVAPNYSDIITYSYMNGLGSNYFTSCTNATGITGGRYSSFSNFGIGTSSSNTGNALPVKLISLEATPINNSYIRVSWATASELDNKGFEVMRSTDGINFTNIGWVDGNNTTSEHHDYLFNDKNVLANETYYYKLNQIDFDGKSAQTYIVSADITNGPDFILSDFQPNPSIGTTKLVITTTDPLPVSVKFYDMLGQEVLSNESQLSFGTNAINLNISSLASATYTAVIKVGANVYSKKLVVTQ